jgi:hypothetical protein
LDVFTGTNPLERISFHAPDTARQMNQSARLTRRALPPMICRYCAAFEAVMRACFSKNFVRPPVPRTNPIIRTKKQNYSFAIDLAHISIAKFGWLCVTPTHNDVRCAHNGRGGVPYRRSIRWIDPCHPHFRSLGETE